MDISDRDWHRINGHITRDDIHTMTPEEIVAADDASLLDGLLGRTKDEVPQ
ncbi:hypothetical protein [Streptomyces zaomyceticus]|uniref:hypothetical protein n=1 Tax=Streptomyces zaomyceticus TaxID=68286 RepID=UPI002E1A44D2